MTVASDLRQFALFKSVDDITLEALGQRLEAQTIAAGTILFEKGDPGDAMILIRKGRVRIFMRDAHGSEITFRYYGPGQIVGEFALLDDKPRSASAAAVETLEVLLLQRSEFDRLLRERPLLGVEMMRSLAERIRYTTQYLEKLFAAVQLLQQDAYEDALREMLMDSDVDEVRGLINAFVEMVRSLRDQDVHPINEISSQ
ncbi:MAG: cyclic nucleotide-binding domain-containing protein [Aggregatilineales bacterium]